MIYKLSPLLTYNLWGGKKLSKIYNKKSTQYGEAWIMSCFKDMNSPIGKGNTLKDIFLKNKNIAKIKGQMMALLYTKPKKRFLKYVVLKMYKAKKLAGIAYINANQ